MRRMVVLLSLVACGKSGDPALDAVGKAQVVDINQDERDVAFTSHLERKGARWTRRSDLVRPANKPKLKADPPKGDDSTPSPALDGFLRTVAASKRGTADSSAGGTVKITVTGPIGMAPVVLERKDGPKWTVDGATLADAAAIDASYRAVVKELGIDGMVEWQHSGMGF